MTTLPSEDENTLPPDTEALLSELRRAAERKSRWNKCTRPLFLVSVLYYLSYALCVQWLHLPVPTAYAGTLGLLYNCAVGLTLCGWMPEMFLSRYVEKKKQPFRILIRALEEDPKAVGALAQLCNSTHLLSVSDIALGPLLNLLPRMKASDARSISDSQMEALLGLLTMNLGSRLDKRYHALVQAILKALEQIGDSRAIEPVTRLTKGRINRPYHQAAQECLTALEQHGEKRNQNRSLLLPSLETGPQTLLRAATLQEDTQPELLLRAAKSEERE